jgi:AcrR family transcriptional regulator
VRVSDVVRAAGMSSRSFYEYFASKEDLLIALIHDAGGELLSRFEAIFASGADHVERVDRALEAYLAAFAGTPLDLEKLGESASARVQQLLRHYVREVGVLVERQLDRVHREGVIRRPPDPVTLEVLLLGLLGLASRHLAEGRADELASLRPRLRDFLVRVWS